MAEFASDTKMLPGFEAARELLAELKSAYDSLPPDHRDVVREALLNAAVEPAALS